MAPWTQLVCLILVSCTSQFIEADDLDSLDWWEKTVLYQIYPRSFKDSNGDGIGDLNGITENLEYLKEIGVGATWLSPIFQSPMYDFGYDCSDFYAIHDEYGTMEDFENLIAKAKELDIKIVLDLVPNHGSNESESFERSVNGDEYYRDWYVWEDPVYDEAGNRQPPTNWVSVFRKSAWEYIAERDQYYLHQFVIGQPDFNYRNPAVIEEMKNVIRFWLDKGVSGFRVDAVNHLFEVDKELFGGRFPDEPRTGWLDLGPDDYDYLDHIYTKDQEETYDMVYQWRDVFDEFTRSDNFTRVMMTEVYASIKNTMRYYGDKEREGAHVPFNFALITNVNEESDARDFKHAIDEWLTYKPLAKPANWVQGNHDKDRVATRYSPDLVDGLNMIVLLLPGVSVTYMGEEIGMVNGYVSWEDTVDPSACNTDDPENYMSSSRDPARTPFQWSADKNAGFSTGDTTWLPVADGYETLNVEVQRAEPKSHLNVYKAITSLRQDKVFRLGRYESLAVTQNVFAFKRWHDDETYLVVVNVGNDQENADLTWFEDIEGELEVVLANIQSTKSEGDIVSALAVSLEPSEALVLRLRSDSNGAAHLDKTPSVLCMMLILLLAQLNIF